VTPENPPEKACKNPELAQNRPQITVQTPKCYMSTMLELIEREIQTDQYYVQNFANDGQRFVAWYLRRVLLRDDIATRDDITDGKDDKQIDSIIVDDEERRILIVQGKFIGGNIDKEPLLEVLGA